MKDIDLHYSAWTHTLNKKSLQLTKQMITHLLLKINFIEPIELIRTGIIAKLHIV